MFADLVNSSMSAACRNYLVKGGSFIRQALRVDKMSFKFIDEKNASIDLTMTKIKEIIDIQAGVHWELSDKYTLTITTPKYIGYHLAKVSSQDPSAIGWIASSLNKKGEFDFKKVDSYRRLLRGLMRLE